MWRRVDIIGVVFAFYLDLIALIVQSFHEPSPNQNEPPFLAVQVVSIVAAFVLGSLAVKWFRADSIKTAWSQWFLSGDRS